MAPIITPFLLAFAGAFVSLSGSSPLSSSPAIAVRDTPVIPSGTTVIDYPSTQHSNHRFPFDGLADEDPLPAGTGPRHLKEESANDDDDNHLTIPYAPSGWAIYPSGVPISLATPTGYATGTAITRVTNTYAATGTAVSKSPIGWPVPSGSPWPDAKAAGQKMPLTPKKAISIDADYCDDHPDDPCCDMDNEHAPECPDDGTDGSDTDHDDGHQKKNGTARAI